MVKFYTCFNRPIFPPLEFHPCRDVKKIDFFLVYVNEFPHVFSDFFHIENEFNSNSFNLLGNVFGEF